MKSDHELLGHVARGEEEALHELYRRYGTRVRRFARLLTGREHLADEVVQETFLALWSGAGSYGGRAKVSTWLLGIARNQAHAALRREAKGARLDSVPSELPDPREEVEQEQRAAQVRAALTRLPPEQREVVFLAFYEALPYRDIGELLGVPEGTVKSRMYHAKRKLTEVLS